MKATHDRQKSYANLKRKPIDFQVRDKVMLKVSLWKGVVRFGKRGKLNPRYVGPFKVLEKFGSVAYKLELPEELSRVHNTFHVSNLKKCYADEPLAVLRGPEFTWEREDQFKKKYPHLFTKTAPSLTNTDATNSGPEPSFDRPAISGIPFWHRMSLSDFLDLRSALEFCSREYVDTTSFYFGGSELVRGASSSNGCSIYLESLPYQRLAYVILVCSCLNASWSNLFADYTTILVAEDACLPAPTPDEVICEKLTRNVSKVGSSVPSVKRTNDVKGSTEDVNDVDDQDDAHYHSSLTKYLVWSFGLIWSFDLVRSFDLVWSF
ncbi:hypothetical protein Tco_0031518 [Tanacetum coccineum]